MPVDLVTALESLNIPSSVLAQYLWDAAGDAYFSSLNVLRRGEPNANHRLIAILAKHGFVQDLFTLNFDLLHEKALDESGSAYNVVLRGTALERHPPGASLYKLHGTISDVSSIRATLDQTTTQEGVGPANKAVLAYARSNQHLLVLGYSGGDFVLDLDYLGLVSLRAPTRIIWNVRPGEHLGDDHPLVRLQTACPELTVCEGELPDPLFALVEACGIKDHGVQHVRANAPRRAVAADWTPPEGIWAGYLFAKVFAHVGLYDRELECYRWEMSAALEYPGPYRAAYALGGMGQWYAGQGHREVARALIEAEIDLDRITGERFSEAVALNNLAFVHKRSRRPDLASEAFE